jgi:hydroxyethylthiazole kinase-like uncharacterized protein yjeF
MTSRNSSADVLLTPSEMGEVDRVTIAGGIPGRDLMESAGWHVADAVRNMAGSSARVLILCGPGNNGGDGFVASRLLAEAGFNVDVALLKDPGCLAGDAKLAFEDMVASSDMPSWSLIDVADLSARLYGADIVVDALLGAGLDRPLEGPLADIIQAANGAGARVLAVDLPTGLSGLTGEVLGCAIEADVTVTFFRAKPGHLLFPGRSLCGDLKCVDIGIDRDVLRSIKPRTFQNGPGIWSTEWMPPQTNGHKYSRGHAVVFSGPSTTTGAARLAAGAALRAGAGLVTVASPPSAVLVNAVHLTAVMLRSVSGPDGAAGLLSDARLNSVLIGPGYGVGKTCRQTVEAILSADCAVVLDADALTSFSEDPSTLFAILENRSAPVVLTPHAGEFGRLFPDLAQQGRLSAARKAAERSHAVLVYKGPDTIIAAPDGRAAINTNATPWLATAGSGDVLAGIVTGLQAQKMNAFEAAAMGVWLHSEAGNEAGAGLIAEDLAPALKPVIARLAENGGG